MNLYTIGFTRKPAGTFFNLLKGRGVTCLIDTRLHPGGQLAGFAKQTDLAYFLGALVPASYVHLPLLAPTHALLATYREDHDWARYQAGYLSLLEERAVPEHFDFGLLERENCCFLCSEHLPDRCHRRLAAECLALYRSDISVVHLV